MPQYPMGPNRPAPRPPRGLDLPTGPYGPPASPQSRLLTNQITQAQQIAKENMRLEQGLPPLPPPMQVGGSAPTPFTPLPPPLPPATPPQMTPFPPPFDYQEPLPPPAQISPPPGGFGLNPPGGPQLPPVMNQALQSAGQAIGSIPFPQMFSPQPPPGPTGVMNTNLPGGFGTSYGGGGIFPQAPPQGMPKGGGVYRR